MKWVQSGSDSHGFEIGVSVFVQQQFGVSSPALLSKLLSISDVIRIVKYRFSSPRLRVSSNIPSVKNEPIGKNQFEAMADLIVLRDMQPTIDTTIKDVARKFEPADFEQKRLAFTALNVQITVSASGDVEVAGAIPIDEPYATTARTLA